MREIREEIERAIEDGLPVLVEGESGTGKQIIGQFLHENSDRRDGPFLKFNCAAMPASLLEAEMFGSGTGAAVSVAKAKGGSVGLASGGTLFLDEIDDMDMSLQRKLARTLKSAQYGPVAGRDDSAVKPRLVCATSIDLDGELRSRTFVQELLDCFAHHRVRLVPLRDRKEDIPRLCEYLLEKFAHEFDRPVPHLSSGTLEAFQKWKWPGNVRELENWIARIVIFGAEEVIGLEFSRQLATGLEPALRYHRAAHMNIGRKRRLRRHR